jgi:hypothetical protein
MYEDETEPLKTLKNDAGMDQPDWAREGKAWEPFVNEMWARYRIGQDEQDADRPGFVGNPVHLVHPVERVRGTAVNPVHFLCGG